MKNKVLLALIIFCPLFSFAQKYESYTELVTAAEDGNAYAHNPP